MRDRRGFTLIELVMIIVILGLLAIVAVPRYIDLRERALQSAGLGCVSAMQSALSLHIADHHLKGTPWVKSGQQLMDELMEESSEVPEGVVYDAQKDRWFLKEQPDHYAQFLPADDAQGLPPRIVLAGPEGEDNG